MPVGTFDVSPSKEKCHVANLLSQVPLNLVSMLCQNSCYNEMHYMESLVQLKHSHLDKQKGTIYHEKKVTLHKVIMSEFVVLREYTPSTLIQRKYTKERILRQYTPITHILWQYVPSTCLMWQHTPSTHILQQYTSSTYVLQQCTPSTFILYL